MPKKRIMGKEKGLDYSVRLPKGVFRYKANNKYRWRVSYYVGSKRKRIGFDLLEEALAFHEEVIRQRKDEGERFGALAPNEKRAIEVFRSYQHQCLQENKSCRSLEECIRDAIERETALNTSPLFQYVFNEFMLNFEKQGYSERNKQTFRLRIAPFVKTFKNREIAQIATTDIESLLGKLKTRNAKPLAPLSHNHYRAAISQVMKWAEKRKIIAVNPVEIIPKLKVPVKEIGIITPDQFEYLLRAALDNLPEFVPILVAGGFCGVRRAELTRLRWNDIDRERKSLKVPHISAKTGKGRFVPLPDIALKWLGDALDKEIGTEGFICIGASESKREGFLNRGIIKCRSLAKISQWPKNALRHSFASHACAAFEDFHKVAAWLGHNGSLQTMMQHYRNVVTKAQGEDWFGLV